MRQFAAVMLPSFFFLFLPSPTFDDDGQTVIHTKTKQGSSVTVFSNLLILCAWWGLPFPFVLDEVFFFFTSLLLLHMRSSRRLRFFFPINRRLDKGTSARERETTSKDISQTKSLHIHLSHRRYRSISRLIDRSIQVQIKSLCTAHTCTTHIHTIIQLTHHTAHKSQGAGKSLDSILYYYYYFGLPFCIYTLIG